MRQFCYNAQNLFSEGWGRGGLLRLLNMRTHTYVLSLSLSLSLSQHLQTELQMVSSDSNLSGGDGRSQTSPGGRDGNEIITQLLEHIVALKLVSY